MRKKQNISLSEDVKTKESSKEITFESPFVCINRVQIIVPKEGFLHHYYALEISFCGEDGEKNAEKYETNFFLERTKVKTYVKYINGAKPLSIQLRYSVEGECLSAKIYARTEDYMKIPIVYESPVVISHDT